MISMTRRERIVKYSLKRSVTTASMVFSLSRFSVYPWRKAYSEGGQEGLRPRFTAPHSPRTVLTDELLHRILAHRKLGYGSLKTKALSRREGINVFHMTVYCFLNGSGFVRSQKQRRKHNRAWPWKRRNELWQLDFKGPYQRSGRILWRSDIVDDASGLLVASVECESASSKVILDTMRAAVKRYGMPLQALADKGAVSVRGGVCAFHRWCIEDRVQHIRVRRNQTPRKVERIHRTIQEERERMGKGLDEYHNRERPHSPLGYKPLWDLYDTPRRYGAPC